MDGDGLDGRKKDFAKGVVEGFNDVYPGNIFPGSSSDNARDNARNELKSAEENPGDMGEKKEVAESEKNAGVDPRDAAGAVPKGDSAVKAAVTGAGAAVVAAKAGGMLARVGKFGPMSIIMVIIFVIAIGGIVATSLMIGTIKENLIKALGFENTVAILEKAAEYKIGGILSKGEMPDGLAADFLAQGIEVGQVTLAGDFVRTNKYLAELDGVEVAANGEYRSDNNKGELAVRFKGEIIKADDFVAAVESSPEMYAAYSEGLDIATKYYYSDEVNEVYDTMGINRNAFGEWGSTGNAQKDQEEFDKILAKNLDIDFNLNTSGKYKEWEESTDKDGKPISECVDRPWSHPSIGSSEERASGLVNEVVEKSRSNENGNSRENAAQLLNMTISAGEPYLAANAFMAVVGGIEQAQVGDNGPVNELMNTLTKPTELTYTDVNTGEEKVEKKSILETTNFVAAVSDEVYSREEANNFSRDRVFRATSSANQKVISNSVVSMDGSKSGLGFVMDNSCGEGPPSGLDIATDSVRLSLAEKNSETFSSVVGGNRVVEGGSFISNTLNQRVLGAMPSDNETVMAYQREVDEILARQIEADRATKSPFDVSSPNTFLGSLVRKLAATTVKSYSSNGQTSFGGLSSVVVGLFNDSVGNLGSKVLADGVEEHFPTLIGDCDTVKAAADVAGDLYCNSHNTISTVYMEYTEADWQRELRNAFGDEIFDEEGEITEDGALAEFLVYGADREATVGVKSDIVCQRAKEARREDEEGTVIGSIKEVLRQIGSGLRKIIQGDAQALQDNCKDVEDDLATGAKYTLSNSNGYSDSVRLLSAYTLHDTVTSLLSDKESKATAFRKKYYEAHPLDNSYEGKLARISGLSVGEVQLAFGYQEYLTRIAQYNPLERYNFVTLIERGEDALQFGRDTNNMISVYGLWSRKFEYTDLRSRVYLV